MFTRIRFAVVACATLFVFVHHARAEQEGSLEDKYLSGTLQVTEGFKKAGEGYFSPDGQTIVYQAVPQDYLFYQIYTQPLDGGRPHRISTGRGRTTCSYFAPHEDDKIIFASSHLDPNLDATEEAERKVLEELKKTGKRRRYNWVFDQHMEIFEYNRNDRTLKQLTDTPGYDAECSYSSDGKLIVFCSDRDGDPDLYIMNADGSEVRQLTNEPGYDGGPFFSPDDKWVIYRTDRGREEGFLQIWAISADGKHDVQLTDNVGVNWAPYWHPTEPFIIWAGADHSKPGRPNYDLWLMKYKMEDGVIAPGPITRITDDPSADVLPVFSPDGKRLMWTSNRTPEHTSQLFIADVKLPKHARKGKTAKSASK